MDELALATLSAMVAITTEPTDGNAVTDREFLDVRPDFSDCAGDLVTQGERPGKTREVTGDEVGVGAADPAGADADPHLAAPR